MERSCLLEIFLSNYLVNQQRLTVRDINCLVTVSTATSENQRSIPGTYRVEGETLLCLQTSSGVSRPTKRYTQQKYSAECGLGEVGGHGHSDNMHGRTSKI